MKTFFTKNKFLLLFFVLFSATTEGGVAWAQNNKPDSFEEEAPTIEAIDEPAPQEVTIKGKKTYKNDTYPTENIEVRPFDVAALERAKKGLDYRKPNEIIEEERRRAEAEEQRRKRSEQQQGNLKEMAKPTNPTDWSGVGKVLMWFFIAVAIGLIIWLVMRAINEGNIFSPSNKKIKLNGEIIDLEHIEENLVDIDDLDPVIQQAIRQGNYTLAIRLYYLAILKSLTENNAILWKRDKTNRAYVEEMRNHSFFEPFRKATRTFERIWYGNLNMQNADFEQIKPDFEQLLRGVRNQQNMNSHA